jgi:DNA-binding MarR family transcriptional regulator
LVKREEDFSDRRVVKISLTDYAIEKIKSLKQDYYKSTNKYLKNISNEEIIEVIRILDKINID